MPLRHVHGMQVVRLGGESNFFFFSFFLLTDVFWWSESVRGREENAVLSGVMRSPDCSCVRHVAPLISCMLTCCHDFIILVFLNLRLKAARMTRSGPELRRRPSKGTNVNPFTPRELCSRAKRKAVASIENR